MINHIGKYNDAQAIQDALDAGTLANPYVAMTSAGTLDWNSLAPTPQVETRIKNTYRITQDDWEEMSGQDPEYQTIPVVRVPNNCVTKVETADGTEIPYPGDEAAQYDLPVSGAGDYVVYISISGTVIEGYAWPGGEGTWQDWDGLFYSIPYLVKSEIPEKVTEFGAQTYSDCKNLAEIVIPTGHSIHFGSHMLYSHASEPLSLNNGQNLIPAGSVVEAVAFGETSMDSITIGSGVTFPGDEEGIYNNMSDRLAAVTFLGTVPPVIYPGDGEKTYGAFNWANIQEIHVPVGYEQAYVDAFNTCLGGEYAFQVAGTGLIEVDPSPSE